VIEKFLTIGDKSKVQDIDLYVEVEITIIGHWMVATRKEPMMSFLIVFDFVPSNWDIDI